MLFDERDLNVFDTGESRSYFKEILQCYYSQNYRAATVLLYSFVIYDLYMKLQTMANEGDKQAIKKKNDIVSMIKNDDSYSKIENEVISFFLNKCHLYFNRFKEDLEYLKDCRHKCAHLKVDDNSLFVPKDYQLRMLICSMYDNVLSVKAPFIMDLFTIVQPLMDDYNSVSWIPSVRSRSKPDEKLINGIKSKYLSRMTFESLKKSIKTFFRLLFVSTDENSEKHACGLYVFTYSMVDYAIKKGYKQIFSDDVLHGVLARIDIEKLINNTGIRDALISLIKDFPILIDKIRGVECVFNYLCESIVFTSSGLYLYKYFFPQNVDSLYTIFMNDERYKDPQDTEYLYETLKDCDDFNLEKYMILMVNKIPLCNGFDSADCFTSFFIKHLHELSLEVINKVLGIYNRNDQCTRRGRHHWDMSRIESLIQSKKEETS